MDKLTSLNITCPNCKGKYKITFMSVEKGFTIYFRCVYCNKEFHGPTNSTLEIK